MIHLLATFRRSTVITVRMVLAAMRIVSRKALDENVPDIDVWEEVMLYTCLVEQFIVMFWIILLSALNLVTPVPTAYTAYPVLSALLPDVFLKAFRIAVQPVVLLMVQTALVVEVLVLIHWSQHNGNPIVGNLLNVVVLLLPAIFGWLMSLDGVGLLLAAYWRAWRGPFGRRWVRLPTWIFRNSPRPLAPCRVTAWPRCPCSVGN